MSFALERRYHFEAAHWLPTVAPEHRCRNLHGHSYEIGIEVSGELNTAQGWVTDFAAIDDIVVPIIDSLDHTCLNEIPGLENPTSELLARWLWQHLFEDLPGLSSVSVAETSDTRATYRGQ